VQPSIAAGIAALHETLAPVCERLTADDQSVVDTQIAVTGIAAPTGDEGERAAWIERRMRALSLDGVHIDAAGNVIGTRPGRTDGPPVVVCAHLDTVFPRSVIRPARVDQGRVHAPGIGDNGRGLAVLLALARAIDGREVRADAPVQFVATTGEEGSGDLRGARHFFATHEASAAIAIDGTGDRSVVHRAVGSRRYRVTIDGPGGHSWSDFGVANPLHAAAAAIAGLAALPLTPYGSASLSVTRAGGGLSVNAIPGRAWFEADVRSTIPGTLEQLGVTVRAVVEAAIANASATRRPRTPPLSFQIDQIGNRPCGELSPESPLVAIALEATRLIGREPELANGSTDANVPLSLGIPAIAIGGGGTGGDVHTTGEWYENLEGSLGVQRALLMVTAITGGGLIQTSRRQ
jgi:acetylornithine deacetylase/succinyl-diaminopimelate desuccinylase-like protein